MRRAAQHHEHFQHVANDNHAQGALHRRLIAGQAEAACCIEGNVNGPDLDMFEEMYGISSFA